MTQDSAHWNDQTWPFTYDEYNTPGKVETATRLLKFFSSSLPVFYFMIGLYEKRLRPVFKPNLVVEIETIPSCLTANLDLYIFT